MKKWGLRLFLLPLRLAGLAVIFFALSSVVATIALRRFITPENLNSMAVTGLEEIFHRPVQVDSVQVVFPHGIRISGLRVFGLSSFSHRDFLTSPLLLAKLRLLPLLQRRIEISEFRLWSPAMDLIRRKDGRWNLQGVFALRGGGRRAPGFLVSEAVLSNGQVVIEDQLLGRVQVLKNVELKLSGLELEAPTRFEASLTAHLSFSSQTVDASMSGRGEISLAGGDPDRASLEFKSCTLASGPLAVRLKGIVQGWRSPSFSLAFDADPADSESLGRFFRLPAGLHLPRMIGTFQATLPSRKRLEVQEADLRSDVLGVTGRGFLDWSAAPAAWRLDFETSRSDLARALSLWERASGWGASGTAQLSVSAHGGQQAGLDRFDLSLEGAYFRWLTMAFSGVTGTFLGRNDLADSQIRVGAGTMRYYNQSLSDIRGTAEIRSRNLEVQDLRAKWNGAPLSLKGEVAPLVHPARIGVAGGLSSVKLDDAVGTIEQVIQDVKSYKGSGSPHSGWWLQVFKKSLSRGFPALAGDIRIGTLSHPNFIGKDGRLTFRLDGIKPGLKELQGQAVLEWGPGSIRDVQGLMNRGVAYRVIFLPFTTMDRINQMGILSADQIQNFDYYKIHGDYVFRSGDMTINNFWVDGDQMVATTEGSVDWPQESLDMHIMTRLNHAKQGAAPESLSDEKGRPCLSFFVDGPMLHPDVRLDMTKVPARYFEDFIERGSRASAQNVQGLALKLW